MPKPSLHNLGYGQYNFVDKDPIIDQVMTAIQQSGLSFAQVSTKTGVAVATLYAWRDGKTKRPQFATVAVVFRVLGYRLAPVKP